MTWDERDPQRLIAECQLLKHFYPNARIFKQNKQISILLYVVGQRCCYLAKIDYPKNFPHSPPAAFPVDPVIEGTPHQFPGKRLCLHSNSEVGPQTTGKVICDWTVDWFKAYEGWIFSGRKKWERTNKTRQRERSA